MKKTLIRIVFIVLITTLYSGLCSADEQSLEDRVTAIENELDEQKRSEAEKIEKPQNINWGKPFSFGVSAGQQFGGPSVGIDIETPNIKDSDIKKLGIPVGPTLPFPFDGDSKFDLAANCWSQSVYPDAIDYPFIKYAIFGYSTTLSAKIESPVLFNLTRLYWGPSVSFNYIQGKIKKNGYTTNEYATYGFDCGVFSGIEFYTSSKSAFYIEFTYSNSPIYWWMNDDDKSFFYSFSSISFEGVYESTFDVKIGYRWFF